jgi:hypothetical protein
MNCRSVIQCQTGSLGAASSSLLAYSWLGADRDALDEPSSRTVPCSSTMTVDGGWLGR